MLVTNTDPENRKMNPVFPKMFQIVPHVKTKNLFLHFTVMLHTDTARAYIGDRKTVYSGVKQSG